MDGNSMFEDKFYIAMKFVISHCKKICVVYRFFFPEESFPVSYVSIAQCQSGSSIMDNYFRIPSKKYSILGKSYKLQIKHKL